MSSAFAPIDAATITSLNKGDEKALESIFRTHYDVLCERAVERLKDEAAAAPRLVLAATRELWEEREGFHSTTEIEGFYNEELRHRARAIRSRMAAVHRFEKSEGVSSLAPRARPTADEIWAEILEALHAPVLDAAAASSRRRKNAAHDAAVHIAQVSARRPWRTPAIVTGIAAVALFFGYQWASTASTKSVVTQLLLADDAQTITTRPGQTGTVTLADGSIARLGADSRLVTVAKFGKEYRAASAGGTISITVAEANKLPLEVRLGVASIVASAGEFAIRDFGDEPTRYVHAQSDGIRITSATDARTLNSGETVVLARDGAIRDATDAESAQAFGWLEEKLVLRDVSVSEALTQLYRWYGIDIALTDSAARERRLSMDVPLGSSQAAIAAIEGAASLRFEWVENRMTFKDATARPASPSRARTAR